MTEFVDLPVPVHRQAPASGLGFAHGEMALTECDRCKSRELPWALHTFGHKQICASCYGATVELGEGAIKAMPPNEPNRLCSNCRAMRQPQFGSAWCGVTELGDERARICANFVAVRVDVARQIVVGGRTAVLDVWSAVSGELRATLGESSFSRWFERVEPLQLEGDEVVLSVPDEYTRDWLEQRLDPVIQSAFVQAGFPELSVRYEVESLDRVPAATARQVARQPDSSPARAGFNRHYVFSSFIVGSGNRLAHASALACVDQPGQAYNPLVLYGGVGVGKTHLLQAIGQEVLDGGRHTVLFATSETFTNELIAAIRDGATSAFRERYRSVDYLLLDDIQFIAGKEATQEEFFHTFNALHQAGKQIVVTCDRPPTELRVLEARLRSRFAWGLMADMQPPDLETRMAIVRSKATQRDRRVPETVLNALASRVGNNVRELEGALNRVLARADMLGMEPGMEIVRTVLGEDEGECGSCRPSDVLQAVSAYYKVKTSELSSPQRERRIAYARQMAMYLLREEAKLSLIDVGSHLGGRNHSTVIYGCDKIAESKARGRVKQDLQALKQLIYGVR